MNEVLVSNWNDVVGPDDEVFHLGDVALGPWEKWDGILSRLNGHKILVIGNHDKIFAGNKPAYQQRFIEHYNRWFDDYYNNIGGGIELSNGTEVNLSHFPYDGDSHDGDRYTDYRLKDTGVPLIHGHTHSKNRLTPSQKSSIQIHVGVDAWDYRPVSEDEVIELIDSILF